MGTCKQMSKLSHMDGWYVLSHEFQEKIRQVVCGMCNGVCTPEVSGIARNGKPVETPPDVLVAEVEEYVIYNPKTKEFVSTWGMGDLTTDLKWAMKYDNIHHARLTLADGLIQGRRSDFMIRTIKVRYEVKQ